MTISSCRCYTCLKASGETVETFPGVFALTADVHMVLCQVCGNKRCPHAKSHLNTCTNSNEPGQPGSAYEDTYVPPVALPSAGDQVPTLLSAQGSARIGELLEHLEDILPESIWDQIDPRRWNAVAALAGLAGPVALELPVKFTTPAPVRVASDFDLWALVDKCREAPALVEDSEKFLAAHRALRNYLQHKLSCALTRAPDGRYDVILQVQDERSGTWRDVTVDDYLRAPALGHRTRKLFTEATSVAPLTLDRIELERTKFEAWVARSGRAHLLEPHPYFPGYKDSTVTAWWAAWLGRAEQTD